MRSHPEPLSRRRFVAAGAVTAGAVLLGACSSGDDDEATTDTSDGDGPASSGSGDYSLIPFLNDKVLAAGAMSRVPFALADADGLLPTDQLPEALEVSVLDRTNGRSSNAVRVPRHDDGLERAYFPLELTFDQPGVYTLQTEYEGAPAELSVQAYPESEIRLIRGGVAMPPLETPTVTDARGVDPICTREPACPLHDVTVARALQAGQPLALLIATPAFCQITICGPVLDILLDGMGAHPGITYLHAEVYTQPQVSLESFAPAVTELALPQEPVLLLVGADGVVRERIDVIFDRVELDDKLAALRDA
ncbi:MAG: hypothetical protein Q8K58_13840 [Acidimicrobiales bacterium]|nr:hypothetical protein [Acidimicrobiales bacterium]